MNLTRKFYIITVVPMKYSSTMITILYMQLKGYENKALKFFYMHGNIFGKVGDLIPHITNMTKMFSFSASSTITVTYRVNWFGPR